MTLQHEFTALYTVATRLYKIFLEYVLVAESKLQIGPVRIG